MTGGLNEAFGGSARGRRDLSGLLPPREQRPPPAAPDPEVGATPAPAEEVPPAAPEPRRPPKNRAPQRQKRPEPTATPGEPDVTYAISVYVLPSARDAAAGRRKREGLTNAQIAFDAVDACQHRLAGLVQTRRTTPRAENSLFPARVTRRAEPGADQRRVLYQLRATREEIAILDRLTEQAGAESRSELVSVALEAALLR